jgi:hypothetical protein
MAFSLENNDLAVPWPNLLDWPFAQLRITRLCFHHQDINMTVMLTPGLDPLWPYFAEPADQ